jgi:hypothetical protein
MANDDIGDANTVQSQCRDVCQFMQNDGNEGCDIENASREHHSGHQVRGRMHGHRPDSGNFILKHFEENDPRRLFSSSVQREEQVVNGAETIEKKKAAEAAFRITTQT